MPEKLFFKENIITRSEAEGPSPNPELNRRSEGPRINEAIHSSKVRLIDENGEMLGVLSRSEALQCAFKAGLDLVEISPNADPPVCKVLDYGKYKYEQQKKKGEAKKKQKGITIKEVQMRPMIDQNDLDVKCRSISRFLKEGNKVKVLMRFRGREMAHHEIGLNILIKVKDLFANEGKAELEPKIEGRQMIMILAPK